MTVLNFKGKESVYNHHLAVPYRPLVADAARSVGEVDMSGNLIVQGDNLHGLKSLMPLYGGTVDCVFIDPPYNTGNENWSYNDNVNAPQIKEWLAANPINSEDQLRHDKWCAMMFPRLRLLHELLADTGSFWMTIDDGEAHRAKLMLDEIFGEDNFVANVVWQKKYTTASDAKGIPSSHDHILIFQKSNLFERKLLPRTEKQDKAYKNDSGDGRGLWRPDNLLVKSFSESMVFPIKNPNTGKNYFPPKGKCWRANKETVATWLKETKIFFGKDGKGSPQLKRYLSEVQQGIVSSSWWSYTSAGHNDESKREIGAIFDTETLFDTPKPVRLIGKILDLALPQDGIILDSFAGSGTTAHAVLAANKRDDGNRRFILVEMEDHIANDVTAERVRRVIKGYGFTGTQKTELYRQKLNWTSLKKTDEWVSVIDKLERQQGATYDTIKKEVKNNELIVTGEKKVTDTTEGLGGSFTFCTLGEALELDAILTGKNLPTAEELAPVLFHMATGETLKIEQMKLKEFYLGQTINFHVWMYYKPDLEWLKSADAALTLERARQLQATDKTKEHLVLAAANYISRDLLQAENLTAIRHVPLPYALFQRLETKS